MTLTNSLKYRLMEIDLKYAKLRIKSLNLIICADYFLIFMIITGYTVNDTLDSILISSIFFILCMLSAIGLLMTLFKLIDHRKKLLNGGKNDRDTIIPVKD